MLCSLKWKITYGCLTIPPSVVRRKNRQIIYNDFKNTVVKTPFIACNNNTGHWEYTETFSEFDCKGILWAAGIISLQWTVLQSILHNQECSVCVLYLWVWVCVACDRTKMLGYHALMCMPNPLVLSHNLPVWLCCFSSASRGLREQQHRKKVTTPYRRNHTCDVQSESDQILPSASYSHTVSYVICKVKFSLTQN